MILGIFHYYLAYFRQMRRVVILRLVINCVCGVVLQIGLRVVLFVTLNKLALLSASTLIDNPILVAPVPKEGGGTAKMSQNSNAAGLFMQICAGRTTDSYQSKDRCT
jgi:hypothetical protein